MEPARKRRWLLPALLALPVVAIALGFGGAWLRPLDSFSHFRAHLAVLSVLLGLLALARRHWIAGGATLAAGLAAAVSVAPFLVPASEREPASPDAASYTLLQMNLLYKASDRAEALRRIAETRPDVVTVQELTPEWVDTFAAISDSYPHRFICREPGPEGRIDAGILSRRPFLDEGVCDPASAFAARRVDFNGTGVTVVAHHQLWPWPAGQWRRLDRLADRLAQLPGPILLGADFNAAPWSAFVGRYETLLGARAVQGIGPTWGPMPGLDPLARWLGLPIDNVLASDGVQILSTERLLATTSDHLPVLVRFGLTRPEPPANEPMTAGLQPEASVNAN